jgi:hypothetical protein
LDPEAGQGAICISSEKHLYFLSLYLFSKTALFSQSVHLSPWKSVSDFGKAKDSLSFLCLPQTLFLSKLDNTNYSLSSLKE